MLIDQKPCQVAYLVPDIRKAAETHAHIFGTGPFYIVEKIPIKYCEYRGKPSTLHQAAAFAQWGDVMIELMENRGTEPSIFTDVLPAGSNKSALHHKAFFVDNTRDVALSMEKDGFPIACYVELENGMEAYLVDTIDALGYMVELYVPSDPLRGFYQMVRDQAGVFDGNGLFKEVSF